MLADNGPHDLTLHADAPAVDDPDLTEATLDGLIEVFLYHNWNIPRLERVEVHGVFDWNFVHAAIII